MNNSSEKKDIYQESIDQQRLYYKWVKSELKKTPELGGLPLPEINRRYDNWLKDKIDNIGNSLPPGPKLP